MKRCAAAILAGVLALWAFSRGNDFPVGYHPDEAGKAQQIMAADQPRNFNQPLLMLETANLVRKTWGVSDDLRAVVIAGRWTSAGLAAIAVAALALAGGSGFGWAGVLICGLVLALCPPLLVYAHYFKEDTALVAGIAVTLLGARMLTDSKSAAGQIAGAAVLGLGCAAAASGKYVGLVLIVPALIALVIGPWRGWRKMLAKSAAFLGALGVAGLAINARAFQTLFPPRMLAIAHERMKLEFAHGTTGHDYLALATPNGYCLRVAASEVMWPVWGMLAVAVGAMIARRRVSRFGAAAGAFFSVIAAALSFDTIPFGRYALPLTVMIYLAAAGGMCFACTAYRPMRWAAAGLVFAAVAMQAGRCAEFTGQFRDDSRQRLRQWMAANLDENATVAVDRYIVLDGPGDPWRFPSQADLRCRVISRGLAADAAGTIDQLAADGVEYVAVTATNYQRFLDPRVHALFPREGELQRRREFYQQLFSRGQLIWSSAPSPDSHAYVNPEIRLYRIGAGAVAGGPGGSTGSGPG